LTGTNRGEKHQQKFPGDGTHPEEIKSASPKPISKLLREEAGTGRVILAGEKRVNKAIVEWIHFG